MVQKILNYLPENNRIERIWLMAKFDFVTRFYGSFLGLFWALLKPLFQVSILYIVFTKIYSSRSENFLVFLFIGIIILQFFSESVQSSMTLFKKKKYLLENIQINRLDIFYSSILAVFWGFFFNFIAFCVINFLLNESASLAIFTLPLIILNLLILILAAQLIFSTISIYVKDISNVWFVLNTLLFWGSGIFFDLTKMEGNAVLIKYFNPLAGILINARNVLIHNQSIDFKLLVINLLTGILFLLIGLWVFKKFSSKALEKI